jgi:hypothetical protein
MKKTDLTNVEKQILIDLLPLINEDSDKNESTIRNFKWLCSVPQCGDNYERNKNVFELQDAGIKEVKELAEARKSLIRKLIS